MVELPEHEERYVRQYVESQTHDEVDGVELVQKVGSRRVGGQSHDVYDVRCARTRWWVITNYTNLYSQDDFPEADVALTFHIGLSIRIASSGETQLDEPSAMKSLGHGDGMHRPSRLWTARPKRRTFRRLV